MPEVATPIGESLRRARRRLAEAGIAGPEREARWIAEAIWNVRSVQLLLQDVPQDEDARARYSAAIERRAAGEPLAYVTGRAPFRHLVLTSDRRALIPRPETEGLVDLALERCPLGRALDIGTGTGAIGLSLAKEGRYHQVVATERSPHAMALARENRAQTDLPLTLVRADVAAPFADESFDIVVSNPPYLTTREYDALDPGVRGWEPVGALEAGGDGMAVMTPLLYHGSRVLRSGGWLVVEVDSTRASLCAERAAACGFSDVTVGNDLFQRARYLMARRS